MWGSYLSSIPPATLKSFSCSEDLKRGKQLNEFFRPPSPDSRSYFAAGHERTLPYLEVPLRLAAFYLPQQKRGKNSPRRVPCSLGLLIPQFRTPSSIIVPFSVPDAEHRVSSQWKARFLAAPAHRSGDRRRRGGFCVCLVLGELERGEGS